MQLRFELLEGGVLKVDVRGRETAEDTRELARAVFAEREKRGVLSVMMTGRDSRPIFKVEEYGLSQIFERIAAVPGLRIAAVSDDMAMYTSFTYIAFLAGQRGVAYRAFQGEAEALAWLREPRGA